MGHLAYAGVILVFLDEPGRRVDRVELAAIDVRLGTPPIQGVASY